MYIDQSREYYFHISQHVIFGPESDGYLISSYQRVHTMYVVGLDSLALFRAHNRVCS
jgi:hypothetical protein